MAVVLVVDDVQIFRDVVSHALTGVGHQTVCAGDGVSALEALRTRHVDLVLLDLAMPNMNGLEFLRRLRADRQHAHVPVVVVSALSQAPQVEAAIALGVQARLLKSRFSLRELVQTVNELTEQRAAKSA